jgi:hypothetical protein
VHFGPARDIETEARFTAGIGCEEPVLIAAQAVERKAPEQPSLRFPPIPKHPAPPSMMKSAL